MLILAIESSCDETSAAVVRMSEGERTILSNIIASQVDIHSVYGGVVPEIASRAHIEAISGITYEALETAGAGVGDIEAVGVTNRPGLIGALLVGVNFAKSLAYSKGIPLVPVDHIKGHIAAAYFEYPDFEPPYTALVASGGHTAIYHVRSYTDFAEIGTTRDDAAGEAFDKVGRVIGLPYPGGAELDRLASEGDAHAIKFPSPALIGDNLDFSFSGLKTAAINHINTAKMKGEDIRREDIAASYTRAVVDGIAKKTAAALDMTHTDTLVLAGGVAANSHLRAALDKMCRRKKIRFCVPPRSLCGDNAAMIGAQAYYEFLAGTRAGTELNAYPN